MIESFVIDTDSVIKRAKSFLNIKADSKLGLLMGKQENYISLIKSQNRVIDLYSLLKLCCDADFNWLLTGNPNKKRIFTNVEINGQVTNNDLSDEESKLKEENKRLKEELLLFKNIVKERTSSYGTNKPDE